MKKIFIFLILTLMLLAACSKQPENQMQPESKESMDAPDTVLAVETSPVLETSNDVFSEIDSTIATLE